VVTSLGRLEARGYVVTTRSAVRSSPRRKKTKKNDDADDADDADAPREIKRNDVESESTETTSLPPIRATQTQSQSR
jgi:hypothetical protein